MAAQRVSDRITKVRPSCVNFIAAQRVLRQDESGGGQRSRREKFTETISLSASAVSEC
jgi:hypothetical protein